MARAALRIKVTQKDQKELRELLSGGVQQVRVVLRALALLQLAKNVSAPRIATVVPLTPQAIRKIGHRDQREGLESALYEKQRPGAAALLQDSQRQRIIAMVCRPWCAAIRPKAGRDGPFVWLPRKPSSGDWFPRWEEKRSAFYSSTPTSSRGGKKMWCVAELNEDYITKMEDVLEVYERPYDPRQPVVCLDEKPVTLHADMRPSCAAAPGREARIDSEYERRGTAHVFCAVEPRAGRTSHFPRRIVPPSSSPRPPSRWPFGIRMPTPSI